MHALVGENGAGKSTLGRIVAGALAADGGQHAARRRAGLVPLAARGARAPGRRDRAGARSSCPQLTVAENVFLGREPRCRGVLRRRRLRAPTPRSPPRPGSTSRATMSAGRLRTAEQQKVEILRALSRDAAADRHGRAVGGVERPRDASSCTRSSARSSRSRDDDHPDLALPARGARPRRHGHRAARRPGRPHVAGVGGDRVVAGRGDARPPADLGVPAQAAAAADAPVVLSVRRPARARRRRARASSCAPARSSASPASSARGAPSSRGPLFGAARHEAGTVGARRRPARRPEPAAQPRRRARDDPGVAQGRRPDPRPVVGRERDAVAARRVSTLGVVRRDGRAHAAPARCSSAATSAAPAIRRAVRSLSGGNQQKVLFARTLLCEPARPDRGRADARRRRRREARDLRPPRRAGRRRPRRGPHLVGARGDPRPVRIACW